MAASTKRAKGPRPFSRDLWGCVLDDGRVLVTTGEDFGKTYGEPITQGGTFTFDPETSSFRAHEPAGVPMGPMLPMSGGRAISIGHRRVWSDGRWGDPMEGEGPRAPGAIAPTRLSDGSHLVFGADGSAWRVTDGRFERVGQLGEARSWDSTVTLPDGRLWLGAGEVWERNASGTVARTVVIDPRGWSFSAGPELPTRYTRRWFFYGVSGGRVLLADLECALWVWEGGAWTKRSTEKSIDGSSETAQLRDGSVIAPRWRDGVVVRVDPVTLEVKESGALALGQVNPKMFELGDGRVLFAGGTLFNNKPAEPEVYDPLAGESVAIAGWEKDLARQRKALDAHREVVKKRGY